MNTDGSGANKLRFNIVSAMVYLLGIILLIQLFNLQIVNGEEYRERSNTRLTRETTLEAARGNILDSTGNKLATTKMNVGLEMYKTKLDTETLNSTILEMVNLLESYQNSYVDNLPITIDPFIFKYEKEDEQIKWKSDMKIDEDATAEESFYKLKERYGITNESIEEARKIMTIRYEIIIKGYSNIKPIKIANEISKEVEAIVNEQNTRYPGISTTQYPTVTYPNNNLASHIIGYTGKIDAKQLETRKDTYSQNDIIGKDGIQSVLEEYLKGKNGVKQVDVAVDGQVTGEYVSKEAIAGSDVILTIDSNLQRVTEEALKNNIDKIRTGGFNDRSDAESGAAVVMNVKTGEILAMASYPDYEPENYSEKFEEYINDARIPLYNRATKTATAPGSTFKMVTAIAGLESGGITTKEKINDVGIYKKYADYQPRCWIYTSQHRGHGYLNVTSAIQHSCNYFFYETGYRIGIDTLSQYAYDLGLGKKTGVELPSESTGNVANPENATKLGRRWNGGDVLQSAIGQSDNQFTPLQMAKYISMLANGGKDVDVTLIQSIINADGTKVSKDEINKFVNEKLGIEDVKKDLNFKTENITAVLEGMKGVTSDNGGTAYSTFKNFNIEVGGKTGSATVSVNGEKQTNAWFVGFAPYDTPEIAVVVFVEKGAHGSYTAEVARDIIAQYFGMNTNQVNEDMTAIPSTQMIR